MDFTPGWQSILSTCVALAGIAAGVVTTALNERATSKRSKEDREQALAMARQEAEQRTQDDAATHRRNVADDERRARRDVLQHLINLTTPFVQGSSIEYQRLGNDEKGPWIQDRVSQILAKASETGDSLLIDEATVICDNNKGALGDTRSAARALAERCGVLLNTQL